MAKENSTLINYYLLCYNLFCLIGWVYILYKAIPIALDTSIDFWNVIHRPLKIVQTVAILEIVHCILHWVRSPVFSTFLQVFSRLAVLWGLGNISTVSQQHWGMRLMVISWGLVEPPRYMFYAVKLLNWKMPTWLLFLRYHLFMILYPTGITGEILVLLNALNDIKKYQIFSITLPNSWNFVFNYYYVACFLLLIYIPGGPFMYNVMLKNRQKNWVNAKPKSD